MCECAVTESFGQRLLRLRVEKNWSKSVLSWEARVPEGNIKLWEKGPRRVQDPDSVVRIARALGVTSDYLITGEESPVFRRFAESFGVEIDHLNMNQESQFTGEHIYESVPGDSP